MITYNKKGILQEIPFCLHINQSPEVLRLEVPLL